MSDSTNTERYITVFIPTLNGGKYLDEVIKSILGQQLPDGYELDLLVIDSGSNDNTLEILKSYSEKLRLTTIPNIEFSHGGTRDKAAHLAKGDYVLFLSQDATPANNRWLINMIEPFFVSEKVGCVFGRQIPRSNAPVTIKREVSGVFGCLGSSDSIVLFRHKSLVDQSSTNPLNSFFSDVNSAARRELLVGKVPFRQINYAEDQALAKDMQAKGFIKAYSPSGAVRHSNDYTFTQYFQRKFDEYIGLQDSVGFKVGRSTKSLLLGWIRPTILDWRFIYHDREYKPLSKLVWSIESPFYNLADKAGQFYALKYYGNQKKRSKLSLERKLRA